MHITPTKDLHLRVHAQQTTTVILELKQNTPTTVHLTIHTKNVRRSEERWWTRHDTLHSTLHYYTRLNTRTLLTTHYATDETTHYIHNGSCTRATAGHTTLDEAQQTTYTATSPHGILHTTCDTLHYILGQKTLYTQRHHLAVRVRLEIPRADAGELGAHNQGRRHCGPKRKL
jgi:hypothetical protein